jgi:hypothetical protein
MHVPRDAQTFAQLFALGQELAFAAEVTVVLGERGHEPPMLGQVAPGQQRQRHEHHVPDDRLHDVPGDRLRDIRGADDLRGEPAEPGADHERDVQPGHHARAGDVRGDHQQQVGDAVRGDDQQGVHQDHGGDGTAHGCQATFVVRSHDFRGQRGRPDSS